MRKRMSDRGYYRRVIAIRFTWYRTYTKRKSRMDFLFCVRFLLYAHLQKRSVQALQKAESVLKRRKLLQGIFFYHCISMLQQKSLGSQREGFLSAILGKDVADFVKFFRFAAGLVQNELVS